MRFPAFNDGMGAVEDRLPKDATGEPALPTRVRHLTTIGVWALLLVLGLWFFSAAKMILLGILAAGCVASALHPLMKYVPGPRWVRATVVGLMPLIVVGGLIALLSWLLAEPIQRQMQDWPRVREQINGVMVSWSERFGLQEPLTVRGVFEQAGGALTGGNASGLFSTATSLISGVLIAFAFVFFGTIFLLGDDLDRMRDSVLGIFKPDRRPRIEGALRDLVPRLRGWLIGTLMSMTCVGVASLIGYWIVGLEMAVPLALLAGISEVVPTLGPATSFVLVSLFAAAQGSGALLGVLIVYVIVQTLESYVILPLMMKKTVKISPVVTLFSVVLWGQVFGLPGLLLAIPIDLVIFSFIDHLVIKPKTEQLAIA